MTTSLRIPSRLARIRQATASLGFKPASDDSTGALLRTLAASKPGGRLLELGTGTGVSTTWLLDGMDAAARLVSVETNDRFQAVARDHLGDDLRVEFVLGDGGDFIENATPESYDLVFADSWPGKYTHFNQTIALVRAGGFYVVDDLIPQPSWPPEHPPKVEAFVTMIRARRDLTLTELDGGTGHIVAAKKGQPRSPATGVESHTGG